MAKSRQETGQLLVVKVPQTQKLALQRMAREDGEPVAVVVRRLIRAEAQRRGLWPITQNQVQGGAR